MPEVGFPGGGRKRAAVAAFAVGWVLIAGGTAGAVVAVGRSHTSQNAEGSAGGTAAPSTAANQTSSMTPTPTAAPSSSPASLSPPLNPPAVPRSTPAPSSTVKGKVAKGVHSGDLRFFLLPVPSDASAIGTPDGDPLTAAGVAAAYSNGSDVLKALKQFGFKDGAARVYQTGDAKYHVNVRLLHFSSAAVAKAWAVNDKPLSSWKAFSIPGYPDVKAYDIPLDASAGEARLRAVGFRGDVFFEINVFGQPPVDHEVLIDRVRKQIARLDTGS